MQRVYAKINTESGRAQRLSTRTEGRVGVKTESRVRVKTGGRVGVMR